MAFKNLYNPIMIAKYSGFLQDKPINDKLIDIPTYGKQNYPTFSYEITNRKDHQSWFNEGSQGFVSPQWFKELI